VLFKFHASDRFKFTRSTATGRTAGWTDGQTNTQRGGEPPSRAPPATRQRRGAARLTFARAAAQLHRFARYYPKLLDLDRQSRVSGTFSRTLEQDVAPVCPLHNPRLGVRAHTPQTGAQIQSGGQVQVAVLPGPSTAPPPVLSPFSRTEAIAEPARTQCGLSPDSWKRTRDRWTDALNPEHHDFSRVTTGTSSSPAHEGP
jgi:hypothetical protein